MHLRKVEDIYGEGSLRILGAMPARWNKENNMKKLMKKFFVDKDLSVREELLKEIKYDHGLQKHYHQKYLEDEKLRHHNHE